MNNGRVFTPASYFSIIPFSDHTKYMAPRSFMWITEMVVPHGPTPAVWPKGWTLSSAAGPCLSGASWSALRRLASDL